MERLRNSFSAAQHFPRWHEYRQPRRVITTTRVPSFAEMKRVNWGLICALAFCAAVWTVIGFAAVQALAAVSQ